MITNKQKSSKSMAFAKGGTNKMVSKQSASPAKPSAHSTAGGRMVGKQSASPAKPC